MGSIFSWTGDNRSDHHAIVETDVCAHQTIVDDNIFIDGNANEIENRDDRKKLENCKSELHEFKSILKQKDESYYNFSNISPGDILGVDFPLDFPFVFKNVRFSGTPTVFEFVKLTKRQMKKERRKYKKEESNVT